MSEEELRLIRKIRNRHGNITGNPVRLFPRNVDAVLLAGLKQRLDTQYDSNTVIQAAYRLNVNNVTVSRLHINGVEKPGMIPLPSPRRCSF